MAIGMGKFFGFRFPENFLITLTSLKALQNSGVVGISPQHWFLDFLYIPLGEQSKYTALVVQCPGGLAGHRFMARCCLELCGVGACLCLFAGTGEILLTQLPVQTTAIFSSFLCDFLCHAELFYF